MNLEIMKRLAHVQWVENASRGELSLSPCQISTLKMLFEDDKPKKTTFYAPKIAKVIFNKPATIVFWEDGDKTIVKCSKNDIYDPEKGLAMAISKKYFGNTGRYFEEFKKWIPEEEAEEEDDEDFHYIIKNPDIVDESMTIKDIDKEILTLMLAEGRPNIDERIRKLKLRKEELKRLEKEAKHD